MCATNKKSHSPTSLLSSYFHLCLLCFLVCVHHGHQVRYSHWLEGRSRCLELESKAVSLLLSWLSVAQLTGKGCPWSAHCLASSPATSSYFHENSPFLNSSISGTSEKERNGGKIALVVVPDSVALTEAITVLNTATSMAEIIRVRLNRKILLYLPGGESLQWRHQKHVLKFKAFL